ncbi:stimulus-sensing domain-containing protein [Robiginitomaculum antarcticum]|uniref:stimulus-sensing domain-containing protein n=1 Tax=Robiginitomaculum antarcticum TaxID=437507 RepID=UPI00039AF924|nr:stimulus-sensing domain-containing protein [Robiginitomaculum antarcticum]
MVSKRYMASDINIKKPSKAPALTVRGPRRRLRALGLSALARAIFLSNMVGLLILLIGALTLNEVRAGLIQTKLQSLYSQSELITSVLANEATGTGPIPTLNVQDARQVLRLVDWPDGTRVQLYDYEGILIADSAALGTGVEDLPMNPPQIAQNLSMMERIESGAQSLVRAIPSVKRRRALLKRDLNEDIRSALLGEPVAGERYDEGELIAVVNYPVKRVQAVVGVLTMETRDLQAIVDAERASLAPIALLALITALLSSLALTLFIALPVRRLARAAQIVTRSSDNRGAIPDLSGRQDEIGDLSITLREMTDGLYNRINDIANFAADVAHEIKNPLTSLRSATETLSSAKTKAQRDKMVSIIQSDVMRMDRLITDIAKASRMDAELARESDGPVEIEKMLENMAQLYDQTAQSDRPTVRYLSADNAAGEPIIISGVAEALGQVVRNLIDNALTFSPPGGHVRLRVRRGAGEHAEMAVITVDDDGPGIPPDNLDNIFERFYTQRAKGQAFGAHSGLGLAICRQIVRAHRGEIYAENRGHEGAVSGAKFTVLLPLYRE